MNAPASSPNPETVQRQEAIDAIDEVGRAVSHAIRDEVRRASKALEALARLREEDDEIRAWDRFAAAAILRAPPVDTAEELAAFADEVCQAFMLRRRARFDEAPAADGAAATGRAIAGEGSRLRALIEGAQELEAHFHASKGTRADLAERAKLLRDRADRMLGIDPPPPDAESPDEKNAAADRRVAAGLENGAPNGASSASSKAAP